MKSRVRVVDGGQPYVLAGGRARYHIEVDGVCVVYVDAAEGDDRIAEIVARALRNSLAVLR